MTKKQKKTLRRILLAAVLSLCVFLVTVFLELPWFLQLALWLVPYLVIGHDVLKKAVLVTKYLLGIKDLGSRLRTNYIRVRRKKSHLEHLQNFLKTDAI